MSAVLISLLQYAVSGVFVLLAAAAIRDYLRYRTRPRLSLAVAVALLAATSVSSQMPELADLGGDAQRILPLALFVGSGAAFLGFRASIIPIRRVTLALIWLLLAVIIVFTSIVITGQAHGVQVGPLASASTVLVTLAFCACVLEPVVRFWVESVRRPAVQRRRLQSLALGYAGIIVILLLSVAGGPAVQSVPGQLLIQAMSLIVAPLILFGFSPPGWLRRAWREPEEEGLRSANRDLMLFSPDRATLGRRSVEWATRLVGGDAAFLVDADGSILAQHGMTAAEALAAAHSLELNRDAVVEQGGIVRVMALLELHSGRGTLVVRAGPYTPLFGSDEAMRLRHYATNVAVALDRTVLTERVAALERSKGQFLNLASHELRGPLTVIAGYVSMFAAGTLGEMPPQASKALPMLLAKTEEMNSLVEQMLEAARLEENRLELHFVREDLRSLVRRAVESVRPLAESTHRLVMHEPSGEVPVEVDAQRVGTILTNLLSNAVKYSPGGGEVECSVARDGLGATVRVSDHGLGIAADDQKLLFTRFGRVVTDDTRHIPGTGLGLYLSRELARRHGGELSVETEAGKGSTFVLALPSASEGRDPG